jgi:hypothetical protein
MPIGVYVSWYMCPALTGGYLQEEEALEMAKAPPTPEPATTAGTLSKAGFPKKPQGVGDLKRHGWVQDTGNNVVP